MGGVMDDALLKQVESASNRLDELAAKLEALGGALTEASFSMLDYAQPATSAAPRSPEVLGEEQRRQIP
jgi:hypothetical protein